MTECVKGDKTPETAMKIKGYLMDFNCFNVHANAYETSLHYWAEKSSDDRYYVHMAKHLPEGFTVKEL